MSTIDMRDLKSSTINNIVFADPVKEDTVIKTPHRISLGPGRMIFLCADHSEAKIPRESLASLILALQFAEGNW